jgi:hypothetical protein
MLNTVSFLIVFSTIGSISDNKTIIIIIIDVIIINKLFIRSSLMIAISLNLLFGIQCFVTRDQSFDLLFQHLF